LAEPTLASRAGIRDPAAGSLLRPCFVRAASRDEERDEIAAVFDDSTRPAHLDAAAARDVPQHDCIAKPARAGTAQCHRPSILAVAAKPHEAD
jgi:hypothetical protein